MVISLDLDIINILPMPTFSSILDPNSEKKITKLSTNCVKSAFFTNPPSTYIIDIVYDMSLGIFVYNQYMADAHTFISSESGYGKVNRIQERKLRIQP